MLGIQQRLDLCGFVLRLALAVFVEGQAALVRIARLAERPDLAFEDGVVAEIIGGRCQQR